MAAREPDSDRQTLDQEIEGSNPSSPAIPTSRRDRRTPGHHIWCSRAGRASRGLQIGSPEMRRCAPDSTSERLPDSRDGHVHLMPRTARRDPRRHRFDAVVAASVAACRAEVMSERTIEFCLEGLGALALPQSIARVSGGRRVSRALEGERAPQGRDGDRPKWAQAPAWRRCSRCGPLPSFGPFRGGRR